MTNIHTGSTCTCGATGCPWACELYVVYTKSVEKSKLVDIGKAPYQN